MKVVDFPIWLKVVVVITLLLLGAELIIFIPWVCHSISGGSFSKWLDKWQTLLAGILALLGAMWTVYYIHVQIKQVDVLERARRSREEVAARAVLPLALSQLVQYANKCMDEIKKHSVRPGLWPPDPMPADIVVPDVPAGVIGTLQECVRYGDQRVVRQISTLLAELQVQQARFRELMLRSAGRGDQRIPRFDSINAMIDVAEIHAKASALFEYGREIADMGTRSTRQEIDSAFFRVGIVTVDEGDLSQILDNRYPV